MPAVSKKQFKFMEAVKHGRIRKKGLSKKKASEFVPKGLYSHLPERANSKKKSKARR